MAKTKLNIDLLKRLKTRFLRMRHKKHFDMRSWGHKTDCGTVACIAGHTLLLQGYRLRRHQYVTPEGAPVYDMPAAARRELGLSDNRLFYDMRLKTPKQAAARIQELINNAEGVQS